MATISRHDVPSFRRASVRAWITRRPMTAFVGLTYAISWAWWWPLLWADGPVRVGVGWPTQLPGLLGPAIAAIVVTAVVEGKTGLRHLGARLVRWRVGLGWLAVVAIIVAGGIAALATGAATRGASWTAYPGMVGGWGPILGFLLVLLVNGFGEEVGWRGFAVERWAQRRSLLVTALLVAAVWAPWHLPLFFVQASFQAFAPTDVVGWAVGLTAGSLVLAWLYLRAGRSILLVAVWHTLFNFTSATPAASGAMAATTSTLVMVAAVVIIGLEVRHRSRP